MGRDCGDANRTKIDRRLELNAGLSLPRRYPRPTQYTDTDDTKRRGWVRNKPTQDRTRLEWATHFLRAAHSSRIWSPNRV
jgi:hypothetical protein